MQKSFFDVEEREKKLTKLGDILYKINEVVDWSIFVPTLDKVFPKEVNLKGGRPRFDSLFMFKILVIKRLYNLSFSQTEYQINDKISFMRFLGIGLEDTIPDANTIWNYDNALSESEAGKEIFDLFFKVLEDKGYITREGSIIDATFIEAPRRKNTKEQREMLKEGKIPEEWDDKDHPQKLRQRDTDATWTKKRNESHFGYKSTVKVDLDSKFITDFTATTAATNDLEAAKGLFNEKDKVAYGDSAYPFIELPSNVKNEICEKATRNHPLTEEQKAENHRKAKRRCRVEHVFAGMVQMVGGTFVRCKNKKRAVFNIAMLNLIYNMRRLVSFSAPVPRAKMLSRG